jgi:hypothetical protein
MRTRFWTVVLSASLLAAGAPGLLAQGGHFEISGHYGRWTLDLLGNAAVDLIDDASADGLKGAIEDEINTLYPNLVATQFNQTLTFDSHGDNFGLGVRWYPGGRRGSFSLGLSVEKSSFKVLPTAAVLMDLYDYSTLETATFDGTAEASALIKATSFLLTFRWDIFPTKAIHPYITFGGGISTAKALDNSTMSYHFTGQLAGDTIPGQTIEGSETKTLRELRDEALADEETDFPIPNFLPFVQFNLGLKARLTKSLHLLVDAGVFDGFMVSAGIALRI